MFKHVCLFVFRNDYETNGDIVFLSFVLMNLIFLIKHNGKVNFQFFNRIIYIRFAKFKARFSWLENLEKYRARSYISENVYFDIIVFSCLSFTEPCLEFLFICFARQIKELQQISWVNEVDFTEMMYVSLKISAQD